MLFTLFFCFNYRCGAPPYLVIGQAGCWEGQMPAFAINCYLWLTKTYFDVSQVTLVGLL